MKYICLGYIEEKKWETISENEQKAMMDECFAYDDVLRKNGHFVGGEALQTTRNAITLRWQNGKVSITDGPYAETKEQLGGILVLEARDLNHAIQLMSKHPGVKAGPFEIRPAADLSEMIRQSERRRGTRNTECSSPVDNTGSLEVTTPTEREIVMTRHFNAPRSLLFDALTQPELLKRWLLGPPGYSLPVCESDLRVGGAIRYVWRGVDGTEMGMRGVYREILRPERIAHTEVFDEDWTGGETQVTNILTEQDGQTKLTLRVQYSSREARDGALNTGMAQGVAASYDRLAEWLASRPVRELAPAAT